MLFGWKPSKVISAKSIGCRRAFLLFESFTNTKKIPRKQLVSRYFLSNGSENHLTGVSALLSLSSAGTSSVAAGSLTSVASGSASAVSVALTTDAS